MSTASWLLLFFLFESYSIADDDNDYKSILISFKKKIIEQKIDTLNRENTTIVYRQGESRAMLLCFKSKRH